MNTEDLDSIPNPYPTSSNKKKKDGLIDPRSAPKAQPMSVSNMTRSVINNKRGFVPLITQEDIDGEQSQDLNESADFNEVEVNFHDDPPIKK